LFEVNLGKKKKVIKISSQENLGIEVHVCNPSYAGIRGRRIMENCNLRLPLDKEFEILSEK
jgi:hypothetical protein